VTPNPVLIRRSRMSPQAATGRRPSDGNRPINDRGAEGRPGSLGRLLRAGLAGLVGVLTAAVALTSADAKVLRTNLRADPAMVDPVTYSELVAGDVMKNLYEGFTDIDKDGNVVPALAVRWEAHPDNKGFRFQLRKGVKFHSGREFTAKDVKWTLEQILLPGNKGGLTLTYLKILEGAKEIQEGKATQLAGVKVVDPYTVEVRFVSPDVLFPIYPFQFMDSGIVAQHGVDWHTKVSAGTGPFKFVHWKRGQEVRLAAHKEYWGGAPHVDEVAMLIVPSYDTAVSMYEANALDVIELEAIQARRVLKDPQFKDQILAVPAAQIRFLGMNQNLYEPFKDKRVREAICLSFDREGLVKGLYGGAGAPLYGQITPGVAGYNPSVKPIPYDPARAKRLMADAGYPDGKGLPPVKITCEPTFKDELTYYADQFKKVLGMPVEIEIQERGTFIKRMNAGEVPFFPWGWTAGYPDAMYFLSQVWYGPSPYNRARWKNAEFDQLIVSAQATADAAARYKLYHAAEQVLLSDWGTCPLVVRMQIALRKPNVEGVYLTPFRFLPFKTVKLN
jgi:peptide/nickel transport system substrate-binding protein